MQLESFTKDNAFAFDFPRSVGISLLIVFGLGGLVVAQDPPNRAPIVVSSSNGVSSVKTRVSQRPTGQLILDRNTPNSNAEVAGLDLGVPPQLEPEPAPKARPVSSNLLKLPAAANSQESRTDYSTASPYQLRSLDANSNSSDTAPLRVTPVSSAKNVEFGPSSEELKLNAPKVSRIPLPGPDQDVPTPPTTRSSSPQFTSPSRPTEPFPKAQDSPSLESSLPSRLEAMRPEMPNSDSRQSVAVPTLLPPSSEADLGLKSAHGQSRPLTDSSNSSPDSSNSSSAAGLPAFQSPLPLLPEASSLPSLPNANPNFTGAPPAAVQQNTPVVPRINSASRAMTSASQPTTPAQQGGAPQGGALLGNAQHAGNERLRMQTPRIQVSLNGPPQLSVGAPQAYQVIVRNDDRIELGGLILRLDIPPGVSANAQPATHGKGEIERAQDGTTMLTWSFENLEAGTEASLPLRVIAESPKNFAVAMEWTLLPVAAAAGIDVLTPQLEVALEGPHEVNFSEPNVFRMHIRNRGNADATDVAVKLSAEHFGSSATQIGKVAAGGQQTVDVELVFNEPGNIIIAAEASASGNVAAASQVGVRVRQSLIEASIEAPERAYHSTEVPFILRLKNAGDAIAKNAKAVISLPTDCAVAALPPHSIVSGDSIICDVSQLRPGQMSELPFALTFSREGDNRIAVQCSSSSGAPVQCETVTNIKAVTDLKLFVTDPVAPAPVNGEVEYELKLVNRGSKAAEQVTVLALFSKDIEPTRAEGHRSQIVTGQVRFQPITRIEPGQSITLKVFAQAATAGMHRFRAEVRTNEAEVKLVQEQSTEYMESIRRTASSPSTVIR